MQATSTVGVLLDELPSGPLREAAATHALAQSSEFWLGRAHDQVRLMSYRLVFRGGFYPVPNGKNPPAYGPLPLTPQSSWHIALNGTPRRGTINAHDLVLADYSFESVIVTDAASPGLVDPHLGQIGGTTSETFDLPADPELLFERTGFACMDELEFPPGSVFEENTWYFYDDTCTPNPGAVGCHVTTVPADSCSGALGNGPGRMRTKITADWHARCAMRQKMPKYSCTTGKAAIAPPGWSTKRTCVCCNAPEFRTTKFRQCGSCMKKSGNTPTHSMMNIAGNLPTVMNWNSVTARCASYILQVTHQVPVHFSGKLIAR